MTSRKAHEALGVVPLRLNQDRSLLDLVTVPALDIRGGHRRVSVLLYDARRSLSVAVHALIATVGESIDSGARETIAGGA